jgi:hypothetical protein
MPLLLSSLISVADMLTVGTTIPGGRGWFPELFGHYFPEHLP